MFDTRKNFLPNPTNLNEDEEEMIQHNAASRAIYVDKMNGQAYNLQNRFETHNNREYSPKFHDTIKFKKYHKRKNQFKIWSEAYYNHGVYQNPPVNSL